MSKPGWLKEKEKDAKRKRPEPDKCCECVHFSGRCMGETKHKGKEKCMLWECAIHSGCLNTRFSYSCPDFERCSMI